LLGIELLTAELPHKLLGMLGVGEAMDVPPLALMKDRVTTRAQRQVTTERVNVFVAAIEQRGGGERDLVRPSAIYAGGGKLPFTVHHARIVRTCTERRQYHELWRGIGWRAY
jgi:hypothetical protein